MLRMELPEKSAEPMIGGWEQFFGDSDDMIFDDDELLLDGWFAMDEARPMEPPVTAPDRNAVIDSAPVSFPPGVECPPLLPTLPEGGTPQCRTADASLPRRVLGVESSSDSAAVKIWQSMNGNGANQAAGPDSCAVSTVQQSIKAEEEDLAFPAGLPVSCYHINGTGSPGPPLLVAQPQPPIAVKQEGMDVATGSMAHVLPMGANTVRRDDQIDVRVVELVHVNLIKSDNSFGDVDLLQTTAEGEKLLGMELPIAAKDAVRNRLVYSTPAEEEMPHS